MIKFNVKLGTAITIATVAATMLAPLSLADNTTIASQTNKTTVDNKVLVVSNTGIDSASSNGGSAKVKAGDAISVSGLFVTGSTNTATLPNCGCQTEPAVLPLGGGHRDRDNNNTLTIVDQKNTTDVSNTKVVIANTGLVSAKGGKKGTATVKTGKSVSVDITVVTGGKNVVK